MALLQDVNLIPYDAEHYIDNLIQYLKLNLPQDYQDFLESNAARVLIDAVGYELGLLAYMTNVNLLQMFIGTATTRRAMYELGKLVGYSLAGNSASVVTLRFYLTQIHDNDIVIPIRTQTATTLGQRFIFETNAQTTIVAGSTFNTVLATQGITVAEIIGTTTNLPNQIFKSSKPPLLNTLSLSIDDILWTQIENIFDANPTDRAYTSKPDENEYMVITFGDGLHGAIPPTGRDVTVVYRVGGGTATNVNAGSITEILDSIVDDHGSVVRVSVTNDLAATGGLDKESIVEARVNIPRSVRSQDRFVSAEDFQYGLLAFSDPILGSVFKSYASVSYTWAIHLITVYVLVQSPTGIPEAPSQELVNALQIYMDERTLTTIATTIKSAILRPIDITGIIYYLPNARLITVTTNVNLALASVFDYINRQIGEGFRISDMYAVLDGVPGVDYLDISIPFGDVQVDNNEFIIQGDVNFTYIPAS